MNGTNPYKCYIFIIPLCTLCKIIPGSRFFIFCLLIFQEQLYYSNLQESINSLAQKLEKLGRAESRGTSNRRKHLNRM